MNKLSEHVPLDKLLLELPKLTACHAPGSEQHQAIKRDVRRQVEERFSSEDDDPQPFGPFGEIVLPYFNMGNIDSLNLFDLDELIIFSFYWLNRKNYKNVLDIGANIGLHSIVLDRCGFDVRTFEPDPQIYDVLKRNLALNKCMHIEVVNAAISSKEGQMEFVRVLGNLTGSHIAGSKSDPYGELERFPVDVEPLAPHMEWADLIKMDAEGHEKEILLSTKKEDWQNTDALVEIENEKNSRAVFEFLNANGVNMFSQKTNWQRVENVDQMPESYREGTLFITVKTKMPWG